MYFVTQPPVYLTHSQIGFIISISACVVKERGMSLYTRDRVKVPLVTITKCMRIVILAAAAQAGGDAGDQS